MTIQRNGQPERLILDKLMKRALCIAGRATTCWKAHREEEPDVPVVVSVARYYHHETVRVRGGLGIAEASNYRLG